MTLSQPINMSDQMTQHRIIRRWLLLVAGLVVLMVLVGGATRLTDSGLSITEWKPVTGTLPPLTEAQWQAEFAKYRAIPQYELINKGMDLAGFKTIFWWEWGHRLLGRIIGAAMLLPWLFFVWRGMLRGALAVKTFGIGLLIGFQGLIGWLMVASGLKPGMVAVAPVKLMTHLGFAFLIFALLLWVAFGLKPRSEGRELVKPLRLSAVVVSGLLVLQILLGALVAGNDAGLAYNTWPLMDGGLTPSAEALFARPLWIENFVDNVALVQLNHRLVAYALLAAALWHYLRARALPPSKAGGRHGRFLWD